MKRLFGTDGMRGEAGTFPLDAETVRTAGRACALQLAEKQGRAPRIVLGRDTRESGEWLETAFMAGAREAGAVCESAGIITTPGVAFLARALPADAGVVISASHNPYHDNGIKIFAPTGHKIADAMERRIEADIYAERDGRGPVDSPVASAAGGRFEVPETDAGSGSKSLRDRYLNYLAGEVAGRLELNDLHMIVDCANGAAFELAPELFTRLGAHVTAINNTPNGRNINLNCGALHIESLSQKVVAERADLGVAFDGDADRALFINGRGDLVDGDATLWIMARRLAARGELTGNRVVATVMSNLGLELALRSCGIELRRTDVGDKYVLEELLRTGAALGGEQSGHIIFPHESLAGDGMITTLHILRAMRETGRALHDLTAGFIRYPQVLVNVRVREKRPFDEVAEIAKRVRETEMELGDGGRLLLRYSGTEPLARVMIEGQNQGRIERLAISLATVIKETLGDS